jgi:hypothetical protein
LPTFDLVPRDHHPAPLLLTLCDERGNKIERGDRCD